MAERIGRDTIAKALDVDFDWVMPRLMNGDSEFRFGHRRREIPDAILDALHDAGLAIVKIEAPAIEPSVTTKKTSPYSAELRVETPMPAGATWCTMNVDARGVDALGSFRYSADVSRTMARKLLYPFEVQLAETLAPLVLNALTFKDSGNG